MTRELKESVSGGENEAAIRDLSWPPLVPRIQRSFLGAGHNVRPFEERLRRKTQAPIKYKKEYRACLSSRSSGRTIRRHNILFVEAAIKEKEKNRKTSAASQKRIIKPPPQINCHTRHHTLRDKRITACDKFIAAQELMRRRTKRLKSRMKDYDSLLFFCSLLS